VDPPQQHPAPPAKKHPASTPKPGAGVAAKTAAPPPVAVGAQHRLIEQARALITTNVDPERPIDTYINLNIVYQNYPAAITKIMITLPELQIRIGDAAKAMIQEALHDKVGNTAATPAAKALAKGQRILETLAARMRNSHPDFAAALVLSIKPLLEKYHKGAGGQIFDGGIAPGQAWRADGKYLTYFDEMRLSVGQDHPDAIEAINDLEAFAKPDAPYLQSHQNSGWVGVPN